MEGPFCLGFTRPAQVLGTVLALASGTVHAAPSPEEMWDIIQQQQKTIQELKLKLEATQESVRVTQKKVKTMYSANTFCTVYVEEMMPQPMRGCLVPGHDEGVGCCTRAASRRVYRLSFLSR